MGLSLQQLRDDVREHLGVDSTELTDTKLDLLLNKSWWQIADEYDFKEKETSRTYNTVIGTSTYATPADLNGLQQIVVENTNSKQHTPLIEMSLLTYESEYVDRTELRSTPSHYIRRGSNVIIYPTPDAIVEITEYYWKTLADLAAGGPTIPQAWHEVIMYGAVYRGFLAFGDYNRSNAVRQLQFDLIRTKEATTTKEKVNRPNSGLRVMRPRYP